MASACFKRLSEYGRMVDAMIDELNWLGIQAHVKIGNEKISAEEKKAMILAVNNNSDQLTGK